MEWTVEQIDAMRQGRLTYGDSHKTGALTWIRTGKETGGEYGLLYAEAGPGYEIFPHYHKHYTETFKVLEGQLDGQVGNQRVTLRAGDEVIVPGGTRQAWGPITEGAGRAIVELRPAHEGFEKWGLILHNMAADGLTKPDLQPKSFVHTALFAVATDTHLVGPARVLNPMFRVVAWFAHKAGVDRQLEEKYYRPYTGDIAAAG